MNTEQKKETLANNGYRFFSGHKFGSTDSEHGTPTESLKNVIVHDPENKLEGWKLERVSARSLITEYFFSNVDDLKVEIDEIFGNNVDLDCDEDLEYLIERSYTYWKDKQNESFIKEAFSNTQDFYVESIINRDSGSQWSGITSAQNLLQLNWVEFEPPTGIKHEKCRYFRASHYSLIGKQCIALITDFNPKDLVATITKRTSSHGGIELVSSRIVPSPTNEAVLIIGGDEEGKFTVWTAYPGRITASLSYIGWENLSLIEIWAYSKFENIPIAVKLI